MLSQGAHVTPLEKFERGFIIIEFIYDGIIACVVLVYTVIGSSSVAQDLLLS
jgi:hypothetical protein